MFVDQPLSTNAYVYSWKDIILTNLLFVVKKEFEIDLFYFIANLLIK